MPGAFLGFRWVYGTDLPFLLDWFLWFLFQDQSGDLAYGQLDQWFAAHAWACDDMSKTSRAWFRPAIVCSRFCLAGLFFQGRPDACRNLHRAFGQRCQCESSLNGTIGLFPGGPQAGISPGSVGCTFRHSCWTECTQAVATWCACSWARQCAHATRGEPCRSRRLCQLPAVPASLVFLFHVSSGRGPEAPRASSCHQTHRACEVASSKEEAWGWHCS